MDSGIVGIGLPDREVPLYISHGYEVYSTYTYNLRASSEEVYN